MSTSTVSPPREFWRWPALAHLAGWAQVFDRLDRGESWPAGSFVEWLAAEQAPAGAA